MSTAFEKKIRDLFNSRSAFVLYRLPQSEEFNLLEAKSYRPVQFADLGKTSGFVVFPFSGKEGLLLSEESGEKIAFTQFEDKQDCVISREEYLELAEEMIAEIKSGTFKKLVLSRREERPFPSVFDPFYFFMDLCDHYPEAFVHIGHYPGFGTWAGASPETLLRAAGQEYLSMSLAGTRKSEGEDAKEIRWEQKEKEEHSIVSQCIRQTLTDAGISSFKFGAPYTHASGHLFHIRADVRFPKNQVSHPGELVKALHPTPAVGGMPQKEAQEFLLKKEPHQRSLYTGFIGETGSNGELQLFVNLRCVRFHRNTVDLFIGGGLTSSSVPEKEWEETVQKSRAMGRFLIDV